MVFELSNDTLYGKGVLKSERLLCEIIRPKLDHEEPKVKANQPSMHSDDDDDEESYANPLGKPGTEESEDSMTPSISSEDSDVDIDIQDAQITDKIAVIQEWLFSNQLPTFSKSEEIMELLKRDEDLSLFFKFIITPFKSMIHHLVRIFRILIYFLGETEVLQPQLQVENRAETDQ